MAPAGEEVAPAAPEPGTPSAADFLEGVASGDENVVDGLLQRGAKELLNSAMDEAGKTALITAIFYNHSGIAAKLLEAGADIELPSSGGSTPLMSAAGNNFTDCVTLLIKNGANLESKNQYGETALFVASSYNALSAAELLLDEGANVHAKGIDNDTP